MYTLSNEEVVAGSGMALIRIYGGLPALLSSPVLLFEQQVCQESITHSGTIRDSPPPHPVFIFVAFKLSPRTKLEHAAKNVFNWCSFSNTCTNI